MENKNNPQERFEVLLMGFQNDSGELLDKLIYLQGDNNLILAKGIITWRGIKTSLNFSDPKEMDDEWEWCWQFCKFDLKGFATTMNLEQKEAMNLITRLKSMRFIYPDGTINAIAHSIIKSIIKKSIEKSTGQKLGGKSEQEAEKE